MSMTTLSFCHEWQKASTSSRHLIITRWASTITLIITGLCHDGLKCHSTHRGKGSGEGWSWRSRRSCDLGLRPHRAKLSITPLNSSCVNGTHDEEVIKWRIRGRKIAKNPRDSWRKDEFIMGRRIPIEIYKGKDKVRRKINRKILNEG